MPEIAGYQLGRLLGKGTFGETYEAVKEGRKVALKVIKEEAVLQGFFDVRRFQREVRSLQKARGTNVVEFIESGAGNLGNETRYFIALEYLEGQDLSKKFIASNYQFAETELKSILVQIVDGLETVHNENIVHRDLKPANVFLTDLGVIKLLDFGLVKMLDYTTLTTMPGRDIGTPLYIAPEILRGDAIDFRADFYSLGILIYHFITKGQYPFWANTTLALYGQVVNNAPTSPTKHNSSVSSEFENLVLTLLTKHPYQRNLNHFELKQAIQNTPLFLSQRSISVRSSKKTYTKKCYFHLQQNEKSDVEEFAKTGGIMDGFIYPSHFLPRNQKSLFALSKRGINYFFDPSTFRLPYSSFAQTKGLVELPYVPDKNNVLTPSDLKTLQAQQSYAQKCLDWQVRWDCKTLVAPYHFSRDINQEWIDIDIKLIEESVAYIKNKKLPMPVYAGICLNIENYTNETNRLALLNRYSRAKADGYIFYVDAFDERTNNPIQIRAYLELLRLFQQLGKPVIAGRVGTLGLGFLASGVDGVTTGIASLTSFSENNLLVNRSTNYDMTKKYYIPDMMLTIPVPMAQDILFDNRNSALRCKCQSCQMSPRNLDRAAKPHFLHIRTKEVAKIESLTSVTQRLDWFNLRVNNALKICDTVRRQQVVDLKSGYFAHLRVWQQIFDPKGGI